MTRLTALGLVPVLAVALVVALQARRRGRDTTVDFYLAGQRIGLVTNAAAICGDYLSAASFLGVAAAVYASGLDGAWYATGFAAGFVPVLLFVAAPMRRLGHLSIPDFLARRLGSEQVRMLTVVVVELVIVAYLVPQAVASGIIWELLVGTTLGGLSPYATGVLVSAVLIGGLVTVGGMRGTTWNQALQFGFLGLVVVWLVTAVLADGFGYADAVAELSREPLLTVTPDGGTSVVDSRLGDGAAVFGQPGARFDALGIFALLGTLLLGTAGLPHVMNRYFTAPTGRVARRTTVWVIVFAGLFYAMAVMLGTAARWLVDRAPPSAWLDELTIDGVLVVPEHALLVLGRLEGGLGGLGITAAAALAAMVSTIGGLLLAAAASWGHDIYERHLRPQATQVQAIRAGRAAVLAASIGSSLLALVAEPSRFAGQFPSLIATMVVWAFALAGASLTPVLLLSIWWKGMTARGALFGMAGGALVTVVALAVGLSEPSGTAGLRPVLLAPTLLAAPINVALAVGVSRRRPEPFDARVWVQMHGTAAERLVGGLARASVIDDVPSRRTP